MESGINLENLILGEGSEKASENQADLTARAQAVHQKLTALKKEESKSQAFDTILANIIRTNTDNTLLIRAVLFLVDNGATSLSTLGIISGIDSQAAQICHDQLHQHIEEHADFSSAGLPKNIEERLSLWWTYIMGTAHLSPSSAYINIQSENIKLQAFQKIMKQIAENITGSMPHDTSALAATLKKYETMLFKITPSVQE